jgi:hypothetical protein
MNLECPIFSVKTTVERIAGPAGITGWAVLRLQNYNYHLC